MEEEILGEGEPGFERSGAVVSSVRDREESRKGK